MFKTNLSEIHQFTEQLELGKSKLLKQLPSGKQVSESVTNLGATL